ncbi:unnamed protein product [Lathyrus sativus]|nr:unnamed protein product [Lathyrus sativus]
MRKPSHPSLASLEHGYTQIRKGATTCSNMFKKKRGPRLKTKKTDSCIHTQRPNREGSKGLRLIFRNYRHRRAAACVKALKLVGKRFWNLPTSTPHDVGPAYLFNSAADSQIIRP